MTTTVERRPAEKVDVQPVLSGEKTHFETFMVKLFAIVPLIALAVAVPLAWGWGLGWTDIGLAVGFYVVTALGVTVGFHRYFTHGAFKATRTLRIALAVAGSMAMQGPVIDWVADHRRHHAYADRDGDPHSPWRYGTTPAALAKGFWHAHMGWLFEKDKTNAQRFTPDLLADEDIVRVNRWFPALTVVTLLGPAVLGGLITLSWWGAVTAFLWAGLVRVAVLHHVTWSMNSLCHMIGDRPFLARDKSANFWPLAIASMGESWHNSHHADPTCARHGVRRGQIDISARLIWLFEKAGWVTHVRWPRPERLARKTDPDHTSIPFRIGGLQRDRHPDDAPTARPTDESTGGRRASAATRQSQRPQPRMSRRALLKGRFTTRRHLRRQQAEPPA